MNIIFIIIVLILLFWIFNDLLKLFENFYVGPCVINGEFGTFYNNECIPFSESKAKISNKEVPGTDTTQNNTNTISIEEEGDNTDESAQDDSTDYSNTSVCFPDNSDFGKICQSRHSSSEYGIKDFDTTNCESGKKKVECAKYYYNKVDYNEKNISSTPCLERTIDFDDACRYYQPNRSTLKTRGYNVNSVGVKQKLYAQDGDCYHRDGSPDLTKARGICNLDYLERVTKLNHFPNNYKYNIFTECNKINSNFENDCATKLNINKNDVYAYVGGFDCNPGYARAKCIDKTKDINIPSSEKKFLDDSKSNYLSFQNINES